MTEAKIIGWIYEDELPESYPYDAMFPYSKVDGVRVFPVFTPVEPRLLTRYNFVETGIGYKRLVEDPDGEFVRFSDLGTEKAVDPAATALREAIERFDAGKAAVKAVDDQ